MRLSCRGVWMGISPQQFYDADENTEKPTRPEPRHVPRNTLPNANQARCTAQRAFSLVTKRRNQYEKQTQNKAGIVAAAGGRTGRFPMLAQRCPPFAEDALPRRRQPKRSPSKLPKRTPRHQTLCRLPRIFYNDLPDAPTGSYLGSMGLPVATGETKIGISAWVSDLYDGVDAHMDADALNADENTVTIGKTPRYRLCHCSTAGAGRIPGRRCGIRNHTAG